MRCNIANLPGYITCSQYASYINLFYGSHDAFGIVDHTVCLDKDENVMIDITSDRRVFGIEILEPDADLSNIDVTQLDADVDLQVLVFSILVWMSLVNRTER